VLQRPSEQESTGNTDPPPQASTTPASQTHGVVHLVLLVRRPPLHPPHTHNTPPPPPLPPPPHTLPTPIKLTLPHIWCCWCKNIHSFTHTQNPQSPPARPPVTHTHVAVHLVLLVRRPPMPPFLGKQLSGQLPPANTGSGPRHTCTHCSKVRRGGGGGMAVAAGAQAAIASP
jgi:hypothetical protein